MKTVFDRKRTPICPGDLVKIFHFVAARRREKRYMYRWVLSRETRGSEDVLKLSMLDRHEGYYWLVAKDQVLSDYEIVQGYGGTELDEDFRDRKKKV